MALPAGATRDGRKRPAPGHRHVRGATGANNRRSRRAHQTARTIGRPWARPKCWRIPPMHRAPAPEALRVGPLPRLPARTGREHTRFGNSCATACSDAAPQARLSRRAHRGAARRLFAERARKTLSLLSPPLAMIDGSGAIAAAAAGTRPPSLLRLVAALRHRTPAPTRTPRGVSAKTTRCGG